MSEVESPLDILLTRFSLSPSSLEKPCDDNKLFLALMLRISRFDDAAPFFGFMPPEIEAIQCDFKSEKSRRLHMLWQWKRKNGSDATYLALVRVFLEMGDKHLAEFVVETLIQNMETYKISEDLPHLPVDSSQTSPDPLNEQLKPLRHEYIVSEVYHPQFEKQRKELAILFAKITQILKEKNISLDELKYFLCLHDNELRNAVTPAESLEDVIMVVRDLTSLINTNYLEAISERFKLPNAIDLIENYNDSLNEFCKSIPTTHAYGQEFMQHTSESLHKSEVVFVLGWDYDDKKLSDVQSLLRKAFHDKAKHVMVRKVKRGNSVILICYAPPHHLEELKRLVKDNEIELKKEKVLSVTIGGDVILERKPDDKAKGGVRSSNISKAIAQPPPEPVTCGYDYNMFISTPPESLKCPVCLLVLREPHQLTCCGVLICQVCIERFLGSQQKCPFCRSDRFITFLDKRTQHFELYELQVCCENHDCVWKGELGELHIHLSDNCQYVIEKCRYGCCKYYHRHSLQFHEQEECPNRPLEAKIGNNQTKMSTKYKREVESPQVIMDTHIIKCHEMEMERLPASVKTDDNKDDFNEVVTDLLELLMVVAMVGLFSIINWVWMNRDWMLLMWIVGFFLIYFLVQRYSKFKKPLILVWMIVGLIVNLYLTILSPDLLLFVLWNVGLILLIYSLSGNILKNAIWYVTVLWTLIALGWVLIINWYLLYPGFFVLFMMVVGLFSIINWVWMNGDWMLILWIDGFILFYFLGQRYSKFKTPLILVWMIVGLTILAPDWMFLLWIVGLFLFYFLGQRHSELKTSLILVWLIVGLIVNINMYQALLSPEWLVHFSSLWSVGLISLIGLFWRHIGHVIVISILMATGLFSWYWMDTG